MPIRIGLPRRSVPVPVMEIRVVPMAVREWRMKVRVCVRFVSVPWKIMRVLVMFVVPVAMIVRGGVVPVEMLMVFTQV